MVDIAAAAGDARADAADGPDWARIAGRAHRALEPLHALSYFADEVHDALVGIGLRPGRMTYFASRAAAMGEVSASVVAATFYNFNAELVAKHIPRAWTLAARDDILAARLAGVDQAYHRLLGPELLASAELAELAQLARAAIENVGGEGRPLYAGQAGLGWPEPAHLQLWHAVTLLREHRGDGHLAALLRRDLNGIDAIVSHTATGRGFVAEHGRKLRGWSEEQWQQSLDRLRARGVLQPDHLALTEAGLQLRQAIEDDTDAMATGPWQRLGATRAERVIELGKTVTRVAVANGAFPDGLFAYKHG
ncbi:MAG TPA: hypothetical protein VHO01_11660 [Jatrophihabitans sp.]|nr:hypothetical protein [Jatrophihabitans sp.]